MDRENHPPPPRPYTHRHPQKPPSMSRDWGLWGGVGGGVLTPNIAATAGGTKALAVTGRRKARPCNREVLIATWHGTPSESGGAAGMDRRHGISSSVIALLPKPSDWAGGRTVGRRGHRDFKPDVTGPAKEWNSISFERSRLSVV